MYYQHEEKIDDHVSNVKHKSFRSEEGMACFAWELHDSISISTQAEHVIPSLDLQ